MRVRKRQDWLRSLNIFTSAENFYRDIITVLRAINLCHGLSHEKFETFVSYVEVNP